MSAIGPAYSMSFVPQGCIGQESNLIEQLSAISLNQEAESCSAKSLELIAANPNTPLAILRQLAGNENEDVRIAVAENVSTPRDLLLLLARDRQADVRYAIAENANLAPEILQLLCEDDNPYVSSRAMRSIMRQKSGRFTECTSRLKVVAAKGSASDRGIKRFINTLSNLAKISSERAS
ncbi:MAG: hypothetical protein JST01_03695 [Cyanobacteria bacterium SZAS TMP-1]|nr:hypothetical protein [Cyanobacteria bacterium SZAS TMP-1]